MSEVKYECAVCDEQGLKSRADWLFHLVLLRHSVKARENLQQVYLNANGNLYVIRGVENVDRSMLLEYVAKKLPTFSNFICFKPDADVCMIVCEEREFEKFNAKSHYVEGCKLTFRSYNEMQPAEWKSFFVKNANQETKPEIRQAEPTSRTNTPSSTQATATTKGIFDSSESESSESESEYEPHRKVIKLEPKDECPPVGNLTNVIKSEPKDNMADIVKSEPEDKNSHPPVGSLTNVVTSEPKNNAANIVKSEPEEDSIPIYSCTDYDFRNEFDEIIQFVFLTDAERKARKEVLKKLKYLLKPRFPESAIVPCGLDSLGLNAEDKEFVIYFDSQGITSHIRKTVELKENESHLAIKDTGNSVFVALQAAEADGSINQLRTEGATIKFVYSAFLQLNCKMIFKPFKEIQTTLIVKELFLLNQKSTALVTLVTYWARKCGFASPGLNSPFVIPWLVYIFLMQKKILPPVIELQKSCIHKIMDKTRNIAFAYNNPDILYEIPCPSVVDKDALNSNLKLLYDWFIFMNDVLGETHTKGDNRRHSLICPRFGLLVDKREFKVIWEHFSHKKKKKKGDQKKVRKFWTEHLIEIGFDEQSWILLRGLRLPDTLSIQNPFYLHENISLAFDVPYSKKFWHAIECTRKHLTALLTEAKGSRSLVTALARTDTPVDKSNKQPTQETESQNTTSATNNQSKSKSSSDAADAGSDESGSEHEQDPENEENGANSILSVDVEQNGDSVPSFAGTFTTPESTKVKWAEEILQMSNSIMMISQNKMNRVTIITELTTMLRSFYPRCELIPIGGDFLGFNVDLELFQLYFDRLGYTNPENPEKIRKLSDADEVSILVNVRTRLLGLLTGTKTRSFHLFKVNSMKFEIRFCVKMVQNTGEEIKCTIQLKPFYEAQTALLSKQLFMMNEQAAILVRLVVCWVKTVFNQTPGTIRWALQNPYVIYWLVYFFLIKKQALPAVIDLQKSCTYKLVDERCNVEFLYSSSILSPLSANSVATVDEDMAESNVVLLLEWFTYIDQTLGKTFIRKHSLVSPRIGKIVNKKVFTVCTKKMPKFLGQKGHQLREGWTESLLRLGFEKPLWELMKKQRLRDNLCIQHPFYLSMNIAKRSQPSEDTRSFYETIHTTKQKLTQLLEGNLPDDSLMNALFSN